MAEEGGHEAIVLADINNTSAVLNSLRMAQNKTLKVVPGIDFRKGVKQLFVGLARNNAGFFQLNTLLTNHLHTAVPLPARARNARYFYRLSARGVYGLAACAKRICGYCSTPTYKSATPYMLAKASKTCCPTHGHLFWQIAV